MTPTNLLIGLAILLMCLTKRARNKREETQLAVLAVILAGLWIALPK